MFKHILVPIDLSGRNARTLRIALGLARSSGARVTVLHVIQRVAHVPSRELRGFYGQLVSNSRRKLDLTARQFSRARVAARTAMVIGEPAREIVKAAEKRKVDLIVMGSHRIVVGRPGLGLGTTSYKVGISCPCPILLVK